MPGKYTYIYRRFLALIPTILLAVTLVFFLMDVIPGDAAQIILGLESSPEEVQAMRARMGLDAPVHIRYLRWIWNLINGNLGKSLFTNESVASLLAEKVPVTMSYAILGLIVALIVAIPMGIIAAVKRDTFTDLFATSAALLGVSILMFWLGLLLILGFSVWLRLLPPGGWVDPLENPWESFIRLIMPSTTLGVIYAGSVARMTRSSLLEVLQQDYIMTARSKGLSERVVIYKHALKNALIPVVTIIGFQFGILMGGSVTTEIIFNIAGMGKLIYHAVLDRDFPVIEGTMLFVVLMYVLVNLIVDVMYMYLNPRVRYG